MDLLCSHRVHSHDSDKTRPLYSLHSGMVFVYNWDHVELEFQLTQRLVGSNIKEHDRFGWRVKVSNATVLVSSLVDSSDPFRIRNAVQALTVTATPWGQQLGNRFKGGVRLLMRGVLRRPRDTL